MPIIIFIAISLSGTPSAYLLKKFTEISRTAHNYCLLQLPKDGLSQPAFSALLCGENVTDENLKNNLIKTSLIHLFVVSGSHLILLEGVLVFIGCPFVMRLLFFGVYALACSWQAPIVRALMALVLRRSLSWRAFYWPGDLLVLFAGLLTLALFPDWADSRSLLMSWLAALALASTNLWPVRHPLKKIFVQSMMVYFFMIPTIWGFGNLHPLGVVYNIFLAPLVTFILFPLGFLACFFAFLVPWMDRGLELFLWVSARSTEVIAIEKAPHLEMPALWIFVFTLHFLIHFLRICIRRRRR